MARFGSWVVLGPHPEMTDVDVGDHILFGVEVVVDLIGVAHAKVADVF